jgi:eukaryotic-like serine/threonine-protein kinase
MIGRTFLDRYRVDRLLCEGGMGKIYIARQLDRDLEVVVKVLKDQVASEPAVRERFRREIQVLTRFQHPYVTEYHGASTTGEMFLVMQYVRGTRLDKVLGQARRLSTERVGRIVAQLCDVLQAAHDQSIVHCDLKLANIILVHPGTPLESIKLIDFGMAKVPLSLSLSALDMEAGEFMEGTPAYMSPEQLRAEDPDYRTDVYSAGVMLYHMLTGHLPFERATASALATAHTTEEPPPFAKVCPILNVPRGIEAVVQKCLAKHRELRPQSAREVAQLYEKALGRKIIIPPKPSAVVRHVPRPAAGAAGPAGATAAAVAPAGTAARAGAPSPSAASAVAVPPRPVLDPNAGTYELQLRMPESMAMLKLRGFVQDIGGRLVETDGHSQPGVIRVRLVAGTQRTMAWAAAGASALSGPDTNNQKPAAPGPVIEMELRIQRPDPKQPNQLTVTLRSKNTWSASRRELKGHYDKIHSDLKAYMQAMG